MLPPAQALATHSKSLRKRAAAQIHRQETGQTPDPAELQAINAGCDALHTSLETTCAAHLDAGHLVAVLGGDHSAPIGLLRALSRREPHFGVLQIDAHADLRPAFEGFETSHASIMHNALRLPQITRLVQVGVRDLCAQEAQTITDSDGKIVCFFDWDLQAARFEGATWAQQVERILAPLPKAVYISFDIDGLDPSLCPDTGTPVPGGLSFPQATFLIRSLARSGRRIIGFDLCEVAPGQRDINAIVGARILWQLALATFLTNPTHRPTPDPDASRSTP